MWQRWLIGCVCAGLLGVCTHACAAPPMSVDDEAWHSDFDDDFQKYSKRYFGPFFDWHWFKAQAIAESRLNPAAHSPAGAVGLMQLMPDTFKEIQVDNPHFADIRVPRWNIAAGIYYDRQLFRKWTLPSEQERLYLSFASYNAGYVRMLRAMRATPEPVESWDEVKPHAPPETRDYVGKIRKLMEQKPRPSRISEKGISRLLGDDDI